MLSQRRQPTLRARRKMNLTAIGEESIEALTQLLSLKNGRFADFTVGYQYMWADAYRLAFGEAAGIGFLTTGVGRRVIAPPVPPVGREREFADALYAAFSENPRIAVLDRATADGFFRVFGDRAVISTDPATHDYLYTAEALSTFGGKKLAAKRNHLNAFLREHADYTVCELSADTLLRAREFLSRYRKTDEDDSPTARAEGMAAERLLSAFPRLPLCGILLLLGGETVGLSIGEVRGDTLYIHVEKAKREIRGAYPMLVRELVSRAMPNAVYVNREEDDGDYGLRQSKLSYRPTQIIEKYTVEILY